MVLYTQPELRLSGQALLPTFRYNSLDTFLRLLKMFDFDFHSPSIFQCGEINRCTVPVSQNNGEFGVSHPTEMDNGGHFRHEIRNSRCWAIAKLIIAFLACHFRIDQYAAKFPYDRVPPFPCVLIPAGKYLEEEMLLAACRQFRKHLSKQPVDGLVL